jgi:hypothetical protein
LPVDRNVIATTTTARTALFRPRSVEYCAKATNGSTIRLLLGDCQQESIIVYTDGFRRKSDSARIRIRPIYVVYGAGEYVNGDMHINTSEGHVAQHCVDIASSRCLQRSLLPNRVEQG